MVLGLAGCSSLIERAAAIHVGDTPAMVLSAMGNPEEQREVAGVPGRQSFWIYIQQDQMRPDRTGWREVVTPKIEDQHGKMVQQEVSRDIYRIYASEEVRVNFTDGFVSSIEHTKR